jgi:hypothetical protein
VTLALELPILYLVKSEQWLLFLPDHRRMSGERVCLGEQMGDSQGVGRKVPSLKLRIYFFILRVRGGTPCPLEPLVLGEEGWGDPKWWEKWGGGHLHNMSPSFCSMNMNTTRSLININ